jgi:hypothetical protein
MASTDGPIKANCVLQHEKDGDIVIKQIPGTAQIADMLTKALDRKFLDENRQIKAESRLNHSHLNPKQYEKMNVARAYQVSEILQLLA